MRGSRGCVALLALAALPVAAQDVGMGGRRGTGARLEAPYTLEVETPHVAWARPLPGGPIRLLAVPTVSEGRTLVELAQRLSLELTTVSIDPHFDANKWTMGFGRDYGARAERGDFSLLYSYLEAELTGPRHFDVILLPMHHQGWEQFPAAARAALERRVKEGCGLVLIHPMGGEFSPLGPADPGPPVSSPWRRAAAHYITRGIAVERFPFAWIQHHPYRAGPGAEVLIRSENGDAVAAARSYGKGRVVAFGYRSAGLSWYMPMSARHFVSDVHWEYFYAMLCRSLIWAAGREASVDFDAEAKLGCAPEYREGLRANREVIAEGDTVEITWDGARQETVELVDGLGRVIARATGAGRARLTAGRPLVHNGVIRAGDLRLPVRFAAASRDWSDYEVIMPWYGPGSYQPWIPALDRQFRQVGITALSSAERNFKLVASAGLHDVFGVYAYRSDRYAKRKAAYAETRDKRYLTRDVVLQDPGFEADLKRQLSERLAPLAPLRPLAYYLADESSLTSYTDAFDVDWAPAALAGFRDWLRKRYPSLEALNAAWSTSFPNWEQVLPMTTEEAQKHGNFAPWAEHRVYMEETFVSALGRARDMVREIDPQAVASISGTQVPTAHNGCNWYEIDRRMDYLQPYSGGNQDAMHHLFRPGILLTGFTGYGSTGAAAEYQQWQRLFYGHTGASIFWHYTILNPDLALSEQGRALSHAFGRIQSGIGRMFLNSRVAEDGVAIHFSMASIRGAWITDGQVRPRVGNVMGTSKAYAELVARREAWVKALERQGIQFRFLATPQIEAGALDNFRVLILPYSIALSDGEVRAIGKFIARGGAVYADEQAGRMDQICRWRETPPKFPQRGPGPVDVPRPFPVEGDFLTTVREFGGGRLIGLLPREPGAVKLPPSQGRVRYDLMRGGFAAEGVEAGPDHPVLLLERSTRIARLEITSNLDLRLIDASGAPVDRSVVHIEVLDPAANRIAHYSGNVSIENGRGAFRIPFALNDAAGAWRIRARDVVSGLTAERVVRR